MEIKQIIAVLEAFERGEKIEVQTDGWIWLTWSGKQFHMDLDYRIAPKKELSLVDALRQASLGAKNSLLDLAADRLEQLEQTTVPATKCLTTDELLAEITRRMI